MSAGTPVIGVDRNGGVLQEALIAFGVSFGCDRRHRRGLASIISATTPVTTPAAMLVPLRRM